MTQTEVVLDHLEKYGSLTSAEAFSLYGITRLSAWVKNLRKDGYKIETVWIKTKNRFGHTVNYGRYELKDKV